MEARKERRWAWGAAPRGSSRGVILLESTGRVQLQSAARISSCAIAIDCM